METIPRNLISDFYFSDAPITAHDLHRHNVYQMLFILKGSLTCEIAGNPYICTGPSLVVIGNCEPHVILSTSDTYTRYVLSLDPYRTNNGIRPEILSSLLSFHPAGFCHSMDLSPVAPEIRVLVEQLYADWLLPASQKLPDGEVLLLSALLYLLRQTFPSHFAEGGCGTAEIIASAVRMELECHFAQKLNLDALASQHHISRYYLTHVFKKATGYSPQEYIMLCRISYACQQLADPDQPIRTVAELSGFRDFSNFSRSFRQLVGMSPSEFRRKTLGSTV